MFSKRLLFFGFVAVVLASILSTLISFTLAQPQAQKIDAKVLTDLRANGKVTFYVVMKEQADTSPAASISNWSERGASVVNMLKEVANRTQQPILARLAQAGAEAKSFWIVNTIQVATSDEQLIRELAARADVDSIKADQQWEIPKPLPGVEEPKVQAVEWGVARVHAPEVWDRFGVRGEGVVVASIDTGVQFNHPALVQQYRGRQSDGTFDHNYNWFDPSHICPAGTPCDNIAHGTHTMGTMVGDDGGANQIGVAPRAVWIAAKGCETGGCSTAALLASGQWVLAPTDLNGENPRPDLRPDVVNNSWGDGRDNPFYQMTVRNWVDAGIFPAFANGNGVPNCGTVAAPGAYPESFGVGAIDINGNIAGFSLRGPAVFFGGIIKPNVSAPGVNVRSSVPTNGYGLMSGTSMATPHLSGVVALVWAASPGLVGDISGTFDVLQMNAFARDSTQCGDAGPPNNVYGWGIVDALPAVQQVISGGILQGQLTDASTGDPIASAVVQANGPSTRTVNTDPNGNYRLMLTAGTYTVTASAVGYDSQTVDVEISEGNTTTQDFSMQPEMKLEPARSSASHR